MRLDSLVICVTCCALPLGCPDHSAPPAAGARASSLPRIKVKADAKLLYTYFKGPAFETTTKLDEIPEGRRGWVRVVDLTVKPAARRDHELVYIADLRQPREDGTFAYVVMSRPAFETTARSGAGSGASDSPAKRAAATAKGQVILYATSWCPACKAARSYLQSKGIPYVEKDIEKDPAAARELMQKASAAGVSASGVPVLDVRGTIVQGFDQQRIEQLLGQG